MRNAVSGISRETWLVYSLFGADKEIDGIEGAESIDNEERVEARTWQAAIVKERDALEEEEDEDESDDEGAHGHHKWGRLKEAPYY